MVPVSGTGTLVLVLGTVQQVAVLVAITVSWRPFWSRVHAQVLCTTAVVCVVFTCHHTVVKLGGSVFARPGSPARVDGICGRAYRTRKLPVRWVLTFVGSPAFHFSGVEQCTILVAVVVASMVFTVPIDTNMSALSLCVVLGHNDTPVLGLVTVSTCTSTPLNIDIRVRFLFATAQAASLSWFLLPAPVPWFWYSVPYNKLPFWSPLLMPGCH